VDEEEVGVVVAEDEKEECQEEYEKENEESGRSNSGLNNPISFSTSPTPWHPDISDKNNCGESDCVNV